MSAPGLFLAASAIGLACTASALFRARSLAALQVPYFFTAWMTGELALHHVAWQAVATVAFVACGALGAWQGWLGLGLTIASWAGLVVLHGRSVHSAEVFARALRDVVVRDTVSQPVPSMVKRASVG